MTGWNATRLFFSFGLREKGSFREIHSLKEKVLAFALKHEMQVSIAAFFKPSIADML